MIPCHYVTFTLFSILGTSIFYHELTISKDGVCPQWVTTPPRLGPTRRGAAPAARPPTPLPPDPLQVNIHFFVDGILLTFLGVFLITTGRGNIKDVDGSEAGLDDVDVDAVEGDAAEGEEGEEGGEARESVAAPSPGSRQSSARSIAGSTAGGVRPDGSVDRRPAAARVGHQPVCHRPTAARPARRGSRARRRSPRSSARSAAARR